MNPLSLYTLVLFLAFPCASSILRANDQGTLKTEYHEGSGSEGQAVISKRWVTSRDGKVIIRHEESDLMRKGTFDQIDTLIFHNDIKVLHFVTILGKHSCFIHPESGLTVLQSDTDGDGRYDRFILSNAEGKMVDSFTIATDGKVTPISDAELKKTQALLKEFNEGMKKSD